MSYPAYPKYQPSGIEWLGDVPSAWELKRSDGLVSTERLQVSPEELSGRDVYHYSIPAIQQTGRGMLEQGESIASAKQLISTTVLLVSKLNPRKASICLASPTSDLTVCSTEFVALRANGVDLKFLYYLVLSEPFRQRLDSTVQSVTRSHQRANPEHIYRFWAAWPSKDEQVSITGLLDRKTAEIDTLVDKKHALIEKLKEKRSALISRTVTRGLPPEAARAAGLEPYPKMKPAGTKWLGEIPAHWTHTRLKHAASLIVDCPHETPVYSADGEYLVVRTADLSAGRMDLSSAFRVDHDEYEKRVRRQLLAGGDIVYGREGERWGFAALVPESPILCLGQRMMQFQTGPNFDGSFLMWQLNSSSVYQQGAVDIFGATSPHVNVDTIRNYWLTQPDLKEQLAIASFLDRETAKIDSLIAKVGQAIERLQEYRTALITAAVTGKIDVRQEEGGQSGRSGRGGRAGHGGPDGRSGESGRGGRSAKAGGLT